MKAVVVKNLSIRVSEKKSEKSYARKEKKSTKTEDSYGVVKGESDQNFKPVSKHPMELRSSLQLQNGVTLSAKKEEYEKKQEANQLIRHLVTVMDELGPDLLSGKTLTSLMHLAFGSATPYVFAQARTLQGDCVYMDGKNFLDEAVRFSGTADKLLQSVLTVPVKEIIFIGVVPWKKEVFHVFTLDEKSKLDDFEQNSFITLLGSSQHGWSRGVAYAQFSTGIGAEKDEKIASFFLFSKTAQREKLASLDAALAHASHSMSPDLIKFLLREGADPAPCIQSDKFLPLTIAVKARQMDAVKILIDAGADPRQQASWSHGTALSWSKEFPDIERILIDSIKDKNKDIVLRPSYHGKWTT